ncbi:DUF4429 domain-containing protein [Rhodococcus sp. AQ5-07]|uniref:DUF4429 domain-containing protein n=1 Tax=Rhodococcus sp. AQ5-07 TaxID=2054902 RepID=UPI000DC04B53|nr:DUF4429 domain-containing protein [Rhodococcus sp. AQ5-07]RAL31134.1 hypothetical protein CVN56_29640 [Rhodococcus sp. AQ5-07]
MSVLTYAGTESAVTFDDVAGTVTFEHRSRRLSKKKRAASPWTVPVGAIEGISWREVTSSKPGEMRLLLRGRIGHDKDGSADWNYVTGEDKIGQIVTAINAAVQTATPITNFGNGYVVPRAPAPKAVSTNTDQARVERATIRSMPPGARNSSTSDVSKSHREVSGILAEFGGVQLRQASLTYQGIRYPVSGARAFVEIGGTQRRTTATRVVVGSVITLGVGTLIGAMAKKKTNNIYLTVEFADGRSILLEAKAKAEGAARSFANAVNSSGRV